MTATAEKIKKSEEGEFVQGEMAKRCSDCRAWIPDDQGKCPYCGSKKIFSQPYQKPTVPY